MYVWARLIRVAATHSSRGPFRAGGESRLSFRCLPTDIDPNLHLNNARYMMLADLGRLDIFLRAGVLGIARARNWRPMMGGVQAAYVREVPLWSRFDVVSTIETWHGTQVIGRHRFELDDGTVAAALMTTAGLYDMNESRFLQVSEILDALGYHAAPREPTAGEHAFMESHARLRAVAKQGALSAR